MYGKKSEESNRLTFFLVRLLQNPTRAALRAHVAQALLRGCQRIPAAVCASHREAESARHPPQPFGRPAFLAPACSGEVREDRCGYALSSPEQASIQDCRLRGHVGFCKSLSSFRDRSTAALTRVVAVANSARRLSMCTGIPG